MRMDSATIRAALLTTNESPTSIKKVTNGETGESNGYALYWTGAFESLIVYLNCGRSQAQLNTICRIWVRLDEVCLYTEEGQESHLPQPIGTGEHHCIEFDARLIGPVDGLQEVLESALLQAQAKEASQTADASA